MCMSICMQAKHRYKLGHGRAWRQRRLQDLEHHGKGVQRKRDENSCTKWSEGLQSHDPTERQGRCFDADH